MENGDIQKQQRERVDHERRRLAESRRRKEEEEHMVWYGNILFDIVHNIIENILTKHKNI